MNPVPLVTIAIPACNPRFFRVALQSALFQGYDNLEIIVCDDSRDDDIKSIVESFSAQTRVALRYLPNPKPLGFQGNLVRCLEEARGEFIKFLCDDDRLFPDCISRQAVALSEYPDATLVVAQRYLSDAEDYLLTPRLENCCFSPVSALFKGDDLLAILEGSPINFLGGLSGAMMRRADAQAFLPALTESEPGFVALLDFALFVCLLRRGNMVLINEVQSIERLHPHRLSHQAPIRQQATTELQWLGQMLRARNGEAPPAHGWVRYAALTEASHDGVHQWEELCLTRLLGIQQTIMQWKVGSDCDSFPELFAQWLAARNLSSAQQRSLPQRLAGWSRRAKIVPVIIDDGGDRAALEVTLGSLESQSYPAEAVVLLSRDTQDKNLGARVLTLALQEDRWQQLNGLVQQLDGADWFYLLRSGDRLTEHALLLMAERIAERPSMSSVYSDEDVLRDGVSVEPVFKPDFNLDLMRGYPYVGRTLAFDRERFLALGGFDRAYGELAPHDLLWRLVETSGPHVIEHIAEVLVESQFSLAAWLSLPQVVEQNPHVLQAHLNRIGVGHQVNQDNQSLINQVVYVHPQRPLVSIIISIKDQLSAVRRCVESLLEKTAYSRYEILIVDNASQNADTRTWLDGIRQLGTDVLRVLEYPQASNVAAIHNFAAAQSHGEYLLMLSPYAVIVEPNWLDALLNHAQRPEIGVVGAKLVCPQGTIVHAGLIMGLRGPVGRPFAGEQMQVRGYMQRLQVAQNWSAVSAECLMVRKQAFDSVGGLDESAFSHDFNDVDLCLRLRQNGYLVVWTPAAQLVLAAPATSFDDHTRQQLREQEEQALYLRWLPIIARDPAYNPSLSLTGSSFSVEPGLRFGWDPFATRSLPNILALPMNMTAVGHYRVSQPFIELEAAGRVGGHIAYEMPSIIEIERQSPDVIILQGRYSEGPVGEIVRLKTYSKALRIYEMDDYIIKVPSKNGHLRNMPSDIEQSIRRGIGLCDRVVVSTQPLADALAGMHHDIRVVPNMLAPHLWSGLQSRRRASRRPRVGWGGGTSHGGDLEIIAEVVRVLAKDVEWVFFGMCPEELKPYIHEFHPAIDLHAYPAKLASLNLDLALAPLEYHIFNDCKSNLRLLEYGACGYPVICTDTEAYRGYLTCTKVVSNSTEEWLEAIRMHLSDPDASYRMGDALREEVLRDYMLQGNNLNYWAEGWLPN